MAGGPLGAVAVLGLGRSLGWEILGDCREEWALGELGVERWMGTAGLLCGGHWRSQRRSEQSSYAICCCTINCY